MLTKKSLFTARYYETGQFKEGERGTRVVFSWAKIIGQYVFWFGSFYAQYQVSGFSFCRVGFFLYFICGSISSMSKSFFFRFIHGYANRCF
ncbi:hypothetical protein Aduo_016279 [Ancylostoma duodenale]